MVRKGKAALCREHNKPVVVESIAVDPQSAGIVQGDQPVQRDPAEHLGVGVMKAAGTAFPNSLIRFTPTPADRLPEPAQHAGRVPIEVPAAGSEARHRVNHLAVDIELELTVRIVSDADWPRVGVAG